MFGTSGIRGAVGDDVTGELALAVGRALAAEGYDHVVLGRDARESGAFLANAVAAGAQECGTNVTRVGVASTPTVARSVAEFDADAGVVITASHNPATDNGIKLWTRSGQAFNAEHRAAIEKRIRDESFERADWRTVGVERKRNDAIENHIEALVAAVDLGRELSVVVDAGNGPGALTAHALSELGCVVTTLNAQPDGSFPGRPSEPTEENCTTLCSVVASTDADLGIAHDGDADRMMAVTEDGEFVPGDHLLALFGRRAAGDGERVAAPLNTSLAVDDALSPQRATVERTPVGDVYVAEAASDPAVAFGGEPSGAWIWPDETLCPDGPLAAVKLAELVSVEGSLETLLGELPRYPTLRDSVEVEDKTATMAAVARRVNNEFDEVDEMDGVRVALEDGWFLVRASGTQPLVRVTAEARDEARAQELFDEAYAMVEEAAKASA
ncbi:phosphoglucosamine mutase [Haloprofundus salilacus]|uniref:phosphoglucosamine mutase n=1 Tax=Haloprofundus salilacus TaxID=2876190 RepID=UPI001CCDF354|nr:phosphoglucosamine mutase [Haloprofundus salilacus]